MDSQGHGCHRGGMNPRRPSVLDKLDGARALGALVVGDVAAAAEALSGVSGRYLVAFLCRLGLLMLSVSLRLAWRGVRRRLAGSSR